MSLRLSAPTLMRLSKLLSCTRDVRIGGPSMPLQSLSRAKDSSSDLSEKEVRSPHVVWPYRERASLCLLSNGIDHGLNGMIWTFACLRYPAKVLGLESDTWRGAPHTVIYDHRYFEARAARESVGNGIPGWARLRGPLAHGTRHHLCWEKVETARISDRTDGAASAGFITTAVLINNGGIIKRNHLHNRDINGQSPPGFIVNKNLFSYTEHVWFGCPYRSSSAALRSRLSPYCRVIKFPPLCIPFKHRNPDEGSNENSEKVVEVLMINSPSGPGLLFPKGGWENDETVEEAAIREAIEEAGVRGF
ncbi:Nudix hydrolase 16, mitochondrial [Vitis vinifera]|uniref:Nudix hydrolase 16, mitochondrial n=1 Tax=Vitis vinifera TaxID=29760 RepID=A0A438I8F6_VITVI|nr:Nudix hydrolase 16, mitochondrial [Vitis vinifera]